MATSDQQRWDEAYLRRAADEHAVTQVKLPERFAAHAELLASASRAIEVACGAGQLAVWLATHDVHVTGYDISPVAIEQANALAEEHGVRDLASFAVVDLDAGLPDTPPVNLVVCHLFRDANLDRAMVERLQRGGILAIAALSEVGSAPGRFRCAPGELEAAFADLELIDTLEADGVASLIARKRA